MMLTNKNSKCNKEYKIRAEKKTTENFAKYKQEDVVLVNQSTYSEETRTLKRRHILRSPEIVITCPADGWPESTFCTDCYYGPTCCTDKTETFYDATVCKDPTLIPNETSAAINYAVDCSVQNHSSHDYDVQSSSGPDHSPCINDDKKLYFNSEEGSLKRFASLGNLSSEQTANDQDVESVTGVSFYEKSKVSSESSETSSEVSSENDEEDEEVILVKINEELRDVVDNHIKSRRIFYGSQKTESSENLNINNQSNSTPSKESEILQTFLEQVETHPQEEDLDVILEIVGEEEEEPSSRSQINIRECAEKFKEIYARKLKQIYHDKYRIKEIDKFSKINRSINEDRIYSLIKQTDTKIIKKSESNNEKCTVNSQKDVTSTIDDNKQIDFKNERTVIDKLPEIRKFHPTNIHPKLLQENRSILKATSLINEIECCFMETAYLVEKSIGSNRPPLYVLKTEKENKLKEDKIHNEKKILNKKITSNENIANIYKESSSYDKLAYNIPTTEKIVNDFQTFSYPTKQRSLTYTDHELRKIYKKQSECSKNLNDNVGPNEVVKHKGVFSDTNTNGAIKSCLDRVPRTLEESIEIFEIILEERKRERMKMYDLGLSSSTLVLNSSKFLQDKLFNNNFEVANGSSKFKLFKKTPNVCLAKKKVKSIDLIETVSTTDLLNSAADDLRDHTPYSQKCKSTTDLRYCENDYCISLTDLNSKYYDSGIDNTYLRYDTFDSYTDNECCPDTSKIIAPTEETALIQKWDHDINRDDKNNGSSFIIDVVSNKNCKRDENIIQENSLNTKMNLFNKNKKSTILQFTKEKDNLNKWKSEPDFGRYSFPRFGFQSSSTEEYFPSDYTTSTLTTSVLKHSIENDVSSKDRRPIIKTPNRRDPSENGSEHQTPSTIEILSDLPLFAQVDELLKGLVETSVDSSPSDYDEGVVSDESERSEENEKSDLCSAAMILSTINGCSDDSELENNIRQIIKGINAVSEKHLGRRIEEEIEKYAQPKTNILCDNSTLNSFSSKGIMEKSYMRNNTGCAGAIIRDSGSSNILSDEVTKLNKQPDFTITVQNSSHDFSYFGHKALLNHQTTAMEQISQISNELKSLGLDKINSSCANLQNFQNKTNLSRRNSRRSIHERKISLGKLKSKCHNKIQDEKCTRSSSCFSFFDDKSFDIPDVNELNVDDRKKCDNIKFTETDSSSTPNSFILKMLHENLRCYVITLAFLEKMLKDNENNDETTLNELLFDNAECNSFLPEKCLPPCSNEDPFSCNQENHLDTSTAAVEMTDTLSPFDVGHRAFLHGLQRRRRSETLPS